MKYSSSRIKSSTKIDNSYLSNFIIHNFLCIVNYKINSSFFSPEVPKSQANKTVSNIVILFYKKSKNVFNTIQHKIYQYGTAPVLIQRILIGFEAML